ncbi:hypothetical protein BC831DRAFT_399170 [Entophlyctis helioformis]|nr:hypothetical protein BC831DRAFT_399170 [Entophlyctis helioformis]
MHTASHARTCTRFAPSAPTPSTSIRRAFFHDEQQAAAHDSDAVSQAVPPALLYLVAGYFALVNAGAVALFYYDKHQANTKGWRVSEKNLQMSALAGGWIGGLWAMQTYRHKTVKKSFQQPYFMCMGVNVVACAAAVAGWRFSPGLRSATVRTLRSVGLA